MPQDVDGIAVDLWTAARDDEQAVRVIPDDGVAAAVREAVRGLARADGVRIRTARIADTVAVVRLDAQVWTQDAATMRRKLTPG